LAQLGYTVEPDAFIDSLLPFIEASLSP
jgi:hypothetical protein